MPMLTTVSIFLPETPVHSPSEPVGECVDAAEHFGNVLDGVLSVYLLFYSQSLKNKSLDYLRAQKRKLEHIKNMEQSEQWEPDFRIATLEE